MSFITIWKSWEEHREVQNVFLFQQKKKLVDEDGNESVVNRSYKIKFIDSARFMAGSLSNLAHNFAEGIHKN